MSDGTSQPMASREVAQAEGEVLRLDGVTKLYGGLSAVNDLSFSLAAGEVLGIIGPNGAGKTTLVGIISGSVRPSAGRVVYRGRDITKLAANGRARAGIARTFQVTQPFQGLDIRDNVVIGALFGHARLGRRDAIRVADEVLERVGLLEKARLKGDELTTADRKRLELARALAAQPDVLLLDEVMAGLTPTEVRDAVELIREINRSGVTVLVIEHIMRAITGVSDRILVMHHGRKIAEDLPQSVLSDPAVIEAYLGSRYAQRHGAAERTGTHDDSA